MTRPDRLRIVVHGLIAQYPLGGVTWDYLQYVLGFGRLGHDVYYLEDTDQWPYNPEEDGISRSCAFNVRHLADVMGRFGFTDRWAYRFPWEGQWYGMDERRRNEVLKSADVIINVSGTLAHPHRYAVGPRMVFIDSDPGFTQVKLAQGRRDFQAAVDAHDVHFTFGESPASEVPETGHDWFPTRQPVVLDEWRKADPPRPVLTTIMNWTSYKPIEHEGRTYGQKDVELVRFLDLPRRVEPTLELAINGGKTRHTPRQRLEHHGWNLVDPAVACPDLDSYRLYIASSAAEWSVAKQGYVESHTGWFSCRSACYLASGRPVIVQDTGFSDVLPVGEGLLAFETLDEAAAGIDTVMSDYERHSVGASDLAREHFAAERVLTDLLERAVASPPAPERTRAGAG